MSKNKTKSFLSAFTIMETVITLVVSSIIIGVVYQVYLIVSLQFRSYQNDQRIVLEYSQLNTLFTRDFTTCQKILEVNNQEIHLKFPGKDIRYHFLKGQVIREGVYKDTFALNVKDVDWNSWSKENPLKIESITIQTELLGRDLEIFESKPVEISTVIEKTFQNEY